MRNHSRRSVIFSTLAVGIWGRVFAAPVPVRITMLGDSITAGYGLLAGQAVPARLEAELNRLGVPAQVTAAGVSGDTTAAGLQRVDFSVRSTTQLCIIALGGNDLLQGLDPKAMQRNLAAILAHLKARKIPAMLVGIAAPSIIGAGFARDFNAVFPAVSKAARVPLYANILAPVEGHPDLIQDDGIHPNAAGALRVAQRMAPAVVQALKARR